MWDICPTMEEYGQRGDKSMKVKELIKHLLEYPMDYDVVDTDDSPVMYLVEVREDKAIRLEPKSQMDVANELEERLKFYEADDWDECDALMELFEDGYTLDDFKYNRKRYVWARIVAEEYGLI